MSPLIRRWLVYDVSSPKRLRRIAKVLEDFGLRVPKSVFECWLEPDRFELLWRALLAELDTARDSLIAYTLDSTAERCRRHAGDLAILTEKRTPRDRLNRQNCQTRKSIETPADLPSYRSFSSSDSSETPTQRSPPLSQRWGCSPTLDLSNMRSCSLELNPSQALGPVWAIRRQALVT